jgi:glucosamine--fructose-6-phosphate aminotransferase (isomerizing)
MSENKRFYLVHNGIIENHIRLKKSLEKKNFTFYSETDTEVAVNVFQDVYNGDILSSMKQLTSLIE